MKLFTCVLIFFLFASHYRAQNANFPLIKNLWDDKARYLILASVDPYERISNEVKYKIHKKNNCKYIIYNGEKIYIEPTIKIDSIAIKNVQKEISNSINDFYNLLPNAINYVVVFFIVAPNNTIVLKGFFLRTQIKDIDQRIYQALENIDYSFPHLMLNGERVYYLHTVTVYLE